MCDKCWDSESTGVNIVFCLIKYGFRQTSLRNWFRIRAQEWLIFNHIVRKITEEVSSGKVYGS